MAGSLFTNAVISFFINTQQARSQLSSFQQAFNGGISRMRNMVIGFIGAQGLKGYYDSMVRLVEVADRFHLPVEQVSKFANVMAQFGGTADETVATIEQLQNLANDLQFHSSGALRDLSAILNVNLANKDFDGVIRALRIAFKTLSDDAKTEVLRIIGTNSMALQRLLESDDEILKSRIANAEKMGIISNDAAQKIRDMDIALAQLKANLVGITLPLIEALKPVLDVLKDITEWFNGLDESTRKFIIWGALIVGVAAKVTAGILKMVAAFKLASGASAATTAATGAGAVGAGAAVAGVATVGAVAGLGYLAYRNYQLEQEQANRTAGERAYQRNILYDMMGISPVQPNMSQVPIMQAPSTGAWVGGQSKVPTRTTNNTTNDNRTMTFNIYGVDGADDLQNRLMTIIDNNVNPTTGWAQ